MVIRRRRRRRRRRRKDKTGTSVHDDGRCVRERDKKRQGVGLIARKDAEHGVQITFPLTRRNEHTRTCGAGSLGPWLAGVPSMAKNGVPFLVALARNSRVRLAMRSVK